MDIKNQNGEKVVVCLTKAGTFIHGKWSGAQQTLCGRNFTERAPEWLTGLQLGDIECSRCSSIVNRLVRDLP